MFVDLKFEIVMQTQEFRSYFKIINEGLFSLPIKKSLAVELNVVYVFTIKNVSSGTRVY